MKPLSISGGQSPFRACEDCEEPMATNQRRRKCEHCGKLVCAWCDHHVHAMARYKAAHPSVSE